MKRILIAQTAFVGDVVLTTPLIRELRRVAGEEARIMVLTTPAGGSLLQGLPYLDEILVYDKKGKDRGVAGVRRIVRQLRKTGFDLAVAAQRSFRTGLVLRAAGIGIRIGFQGSAGAWACNRRVTWPGDRHAVHRYLALSAAAGGEPGSADPQPELAVSDRNRIYVEEMLANEGIGTDEPVVCFAPGSVWGTKRWTPRGYAEVARRSASEGMRPVLIGSPEERALCMEVGEAAGDVPVLAGRTGLPQLAALLNRAVALVGNDSGPAHIASAVGTPVVAVFGPTVPAFGYTPFGSNVRIVERAGLECRPCHHHGPQVCPLDHFRCMMEIEAETVFRQLQDLLET